MERIAQLQEWMKREKWEALLIENPVDLFYLTNLRFSVGKLFVQCKAALLLVDGRYFEAAKKKSPCPVSLIDEFPKIIRKEKKIGFDSTFLTFDQVQQYKEKYREIEWAAVPYPLRQLRVKKESQEIAALKEAAKLTWEGYRHILSLLKEGIREKDLALEFEFFCRKKGASGMSFDPIVAFGENSAYPHYRAGDVKLKKDQIILIDVGAIVKDYCGDMTRIFFFGNPNPELEKLFRLVRKAQTRAVAAVRPGVRLGELDEIVRKEFSKEGVESLFVHNLGHGVGLEVHEYPRLRFDGADKDLLLQPGMVFTIEPGLYKPGLGGIRYEDTILVTASGVENFTPME